MTYSKYNLELIKYATVKMKKNILKRAIIPKFIFRLKTALLLRLIYVFIQIQVVIIEAIPPTPKIFTLPYFILEIRIVNFLKRKLRKENLISLWLGSTEL